jgi:hypothetical protein
VSSRPTSWPAVVRTQGSLIADEVTTVGPNGRVNQDLTEQGRALLLSLEMFVLFCLLQRFAFTCYYRGGLSFPRVAGQALVLVLVVGLFTVSFVILSGFIRMG